MTRKEEEEEFELPEPRLEELHTCVLCRGLHRDTKKENKEAKQLRMNICTTRNHYAYHMALYHGGLDKFIDSQGSKELKEMKDKLICFKTPERCFVPDHYGQ